MLELGIVTYEEEAGEKVLAAPVSAGRRKMAAEITEDIVIGIHYTLKGEDGEVIDSSSGEEPLYYLQGRGQIIDGLERALAGKKVGEKMTVQVQPDDGYGEYNPALELTIPRDEFPADFELEEGSVFELSSDDGDSIIARVVFIDGDTVHVNGNHPLAGEILTFDVEVVSIRNATQAEIEHGHAHGKDGSSHHH